MNVLTELANGAVGGLLGGVGKLAKDIREAWTGELPAEKRAELEQKLQELEASTMIAQTEINKIEAASDNLFVSGWRPFIGWVGGFALAYSAVLEPLLRFVAKVGFDYSGEFPKLDTFMLGQIITAMLGIGIMRSYDKAQAPSLKGRE